MLAHRWPSASFHTLPAYAVGVLCPLAWLTLIYSWDLSDWPWLHHYWPWSRLGEEKIYPPLRTEKLDQKHSRLGLWLMGRSKSFLPCRLWERFWTPIGPLFVLGLELLPLITCYILSLMEISTKFLQRTFAFQRRCQWFQNRVKRALLKGHPCFGESAFEQNNNHSLDEVSIPVLYGCGGCKGCDSCNGCDGCDGCDIWDSCDGCDGMGAANRKVWGVAGEEGREPSELLIADRMRLKPSKFRLIV